MRVSDKYRKHVDFKLDDLAWIHLCKERFPQGKFGKLKLKADGPFKVHKRIGKNIYEIELPNSYGVSPTLNMADFNPYSGDGSFKDLRTSFFQSEENDRKCPCMLSSLLHVYGTNISC